MKNYYEFLKASGGIRNLTILNMETLKIRSFWRSYCEWLRLFWLPFVKTFWKVDKMNTLLLKFSLGKYKMAAKPFKIHLKTGHRLNIKNQDHLKTVHRLSIQKLDASGFWIRTEVFHQILGKFEIQILTLVIDWSKIIWFWRYFLMFSWKTMQWGL